MDRYVMKEECKEREEWTERDGLMDGKRWRDRRMNG
jgi:hypothetical protein